MATPPLDAAWQLYWTRMRDIHNIRYNQLTKEENNMNNNTLDLASLIADNTPEGMEVDKDNSTDGKIVFKDKVKSRTKSTCWEDLEGVRGYYTESNSGLNTVPNTYMPAAENANIYATEAQCKAHLAQAQLSQIMKNVNGDWEADYTNRKQTKYALCLYEEGYIVYDYVTVPKFLAFKSKELAEQVLRENDDLLEQYKPLAGVG